MFGNVNGASVCGGAHAQVDLVRYRSSKDEADDRMGKFRVKMDQLKKANTELGVQATRSQQQLQKVTVGFLPRSDAERLVTVGLVC